MNEEATIKFNHRQWDTVVSAAVLLSQRLGHSGGMNAPVAIEMICTDFISRYSKPEDMTNIVEFPRQEQVRQPKS